jgi:hypothetical protein
MFELLKFWWKPTSARALIITRCAMHFLSPEDRGKIREGLNESYNFATHVLLREEEETSNG